MIERIESLKQVPMFKALPDRSLEIIAGLVSEETFEGGMEIIREGEDSDRLFILLEGTVEVVKGYLKENATALGFYDPIATFGEIGLIDGGPRSATVVTVERSRFFTLEREPFQILLQNNIDICHRLLLEICERLRQADEVAALR
jgi:CRP/FNR family transcriptional regulator, cyclic AMP receptor protein